MSATAIVAPSDSQLDYIRDRCEARGLEPPDVVYSKTEASEIIDAILHRQYDPDFYSLHAPTYYGLGCDDEGAMSRLFGV